MHVRLESQETREEETAQAEHYTAVLEHVLPPSLALTLFLPTLGLTLPTLPCTHRSYPPLQVWFDPWLAVYFSPEFGERAHWTDGNGGKPAAFSVADLTPREEAGPGALKAAHGHAGHAAHGHDAHGHDAHGERAGAGAVPMLTCSMEQLQYCPGDNCLVRPASLPSLAVGEPTPASMHAAAATPAMPAGAAASGGATIAPPSSQAAAHRYPPPLRLPPLGRSGGHRVQPAAVEEAGRGEEEEAAAVVGLQPSGVQLEAAPAQHPASYYPYQPPPQPAAAAQMGVAQGARGELVLVPVARVQPR